MTGVGGGASVERFGRYRAWAPEWWLLGPIGAAWVGLAAHAVATGVAAASSAGAGLLRPGEALLLICLVPAARHGGPDLADSAVMSAAMMLPLAMPAARHVGRNSLRRRQQRAMILFVLAFLVPIVVAGVAITAIVDAIDVDRRTALAGALLIAGAYQLSSPMRRALDDCRRLVPLPPDGRRADAAAIRYGLVSSWRCVRASWALMLPIAALGGGALLVAIVVTGLLLAEDPGRVGRRILRPSAALVVGTAVLVAVVGP